MSTIQLSDPEAVVKARIQTAMDNDGLTRKAVYSAIGISRNTFEVRMARGGFYVRELIRAADALGMTFHELCRGI
ncbi:hypothetical protein OOZ51_02615 [Arthrobacter sp. MI7-26]|uniref:hypothetical protein n=1 Tax=Arthrobacter sp. MI7-26 TaxID=2993653 RepID=UPI0022491863|nr:hypothetical protein [Arthrobacter sp. MI7-26]MCX2746705.1 hypothetical protein [Arthrobacter sp. MI7-26]